MKHTSSLVDPANVKMLANYLYYKVFGQLVSTIHRNQTDKIITVTNEKNHNSLLKSCLCNLKVCGFFRAHKGRNQNNLCPSLLKWQLMNCVNT